MRLAGKVALVTGGASGIGRATCLLMAAEGARVVVADINGAGAATVAREAGEGAMALLLDVTSEAAWAEAVDAIDARHGALHILVNNAGISPHDTVATATLDGWRHIMAVDAESVLLGCRAALSLLASSAPAAIVNLSSVAGMRGGPDYASYGAAKAAVRNLTKSVALHCARLENGVRCNSVHPGSIDTPILDGDRALHGQSAITRRERAVPLHRLGRPEEVAAAILFLASDEASYITGAELVVDGGLTAR